MIELVVDGQDSTEESKDRLGYTNAFFISVWREEGNIKISHLKVANFKQRSPEVFRAKVGGLRSLRTL